MEISFGPKWKTTGWALENTEAEMPAPQRTIELGHAGDAGQVMHGHGTTEQLPAYAHTQ
jgi:hypothetical protein